MEITQCQKKNLLSLLGGERGISALTQVVGIQRPTACKVPVQVSRFKVQGVKEN
jgi:hypothetical protein